jgi:ABC-2 type transport system ATP-binding protein
MALKIENISKRYQDKIAVNQLSITLTSGVCGLLGANGAGKTTLMRMICGILTPTTGSITLNGESIQKLGEDYRELLGYLPQDFGYYPDFTAKEFMHYMCAAKGLSPAESEAKTVELLTLVNLQDVAGKKIKTFSGGMKQRLGIAQANINDPSILILDEPTAGLDPKERVRFRNLISDISKDKIVILSTHITSDVEYIADTLIMMKHGEILLTSTVDEAALSIVGKVWEVEVAEQELRAFEKDYVVANFHHAGDQVRLRLIGDEQPTETAKRLTPTLEDLYLYHFQEEGAGGL